MLLSVISWGAVAAAWQGAVCLFAKAMFLDGWFPSCIRFVAISLVSVLMVSAPGMLLKLPFSGIVITLAPFVLPIVFFWVAGRNIGLKSCLFVGALLLVIGTRLSTLSPGGVPSAYPFTGVQDDDVSVMSWNLGGGGPFFPGSDEADVDEIVGVVRRHGVHVLCLQEVSSAQFLNKLMAALGGDWKGGASSGGDKSTAVLSRIGGDVESPLNNMSYGGPTVLRIKSHRGMLQFVSCHGSPGRESGQRRKMVEWVLHDLRDLKKKTVIAGDFNIDTSRGWTFLAPLLSDSLSFDRATWRALGIMGEDPGFGAQATASMGRRNTWMVVDSKMPIAGYRVLKGEEVGQMDHSPVLLRVGLGKAGRNIAGD
jgi:endonuclease/exonuclease/phosphatase family metal-dependent hydrolase